MRKKTDKPTEKERLAYTKTKREKQTQISSAVPVSADSQRNTETDTKERAIDNHTERETDTETQRAKQSKISYSAGDSSSAIPVSKLMALSSGKSLRNSPRSICVREGERE